MTRIALSLSALPLLLVSLHASAHEGHGLPGSSHWHATDAGPLLLVAVLAAGLWLTRKR
ncbi:MAG: hypothetical protein AB9M60_14990 [Leptothrix sp. (in: b-proteobacteria)]